MPNQLTKDAVIYNTRSINDLIWRIRNGKNPSPRTIAMYREHVMALSALLEAMEQQAKSEARPGETPEIVDWIEPIPHGQIVGVYDPAEKRRLGWKFWFKRIERAVPSHYSIAAE